MSQTPSFSVVSVAVLAVFAGAGAAQAAAAQDEPTKVEVQVPDADTETTVAQYKRIDVPGAVASEPAHYTAEVPLTWEVRRDIPAPGVMLGPPAGDPTSHPEMTLVRESTVDVSDPETILAALQVNAEGADWELLDAEVRDFGGVRGLWIVRKLPPSGFHGERVNLATKLPLPEGSLDLTATLPIEDYEGGLRATVEHVLGSVRPAGEPEE